ncbi:MAG TPA: LysR family transcriptional regulator [Candidatus Didemnitutus sp.]|jgi:LysR family hydrogen peroxide-inducible transcriptional activator
MEIYQLRYFIAVSEEGSFTKAASRLHISQPSLSQQVLNLEEELGQKLFHRLGRQVSLTDAGQTLLQRARDIVSETDETLRELREDPALGFRVNVGAIPTVSHFFIPAVIAYCRTNNVRIRLFSQEDFRDGLVASLLAGEIDWGLIAVPVNDGRLEVVPLFTEPLLLAMAADHPLAKQERISLSDLRDQSFIMLGSGSSLTAQLVQRMSTAFDHSPNITHRCSQLTTLKSLTALGLGISVLPRSARTVTDPAGLVYRRLEGPPLTRGVALVRHRRRHVGKGAQLFADAALAVVGPLQGTPIPMISTVPTPLPKA